MKKNLIPIILAVILLASSNILTKIHVESMSRHDKRLLEERIDSLKTVNRSIQDERILEAEQRMEDEHKRDSINKNIADRLTRTEIFLRERDKELSRIKKFNSIRLVSYSDSLYNAYHK